MGTIIKTNIFLNNFARKSFLSIKKSITPFIAYEDADYPGCTLADTKTIGFKNLCALVFYGNKS